MLFSITSQGLGDPTSDLRDIKKRIDDCAKRFPINASTNTGANIALNCGLFSDPTWPHNFVQYKGVTFSSDENNALLFNMAQTILTQWRNTVAGEGDAKDAKLRRVAASKFREASIVTSVSPTLAVQILSSAGRIESDPETLNYIVDGLVKWLTEWNIGIPVRTEAITTLKIIANPLAGRSPDSRRAAEVALQIVDKPTGPGPITLPPPQPVPKTRSRFLVPIIVTSLTALGAASALWYIFQRPSRRYLGMGPLRHRVESQKRLAVRTKKSRQTSDADVLGSH